ncbi:hypothetical protein GCM10028814_21700 [Angustibacter aerolatus]
MVVAVLAAGVGAVLVGRPGADEPAGPASTRACVYTSHSIARLQQFSQQVGHQYDCALVFNDVATTWPALVNPWFVQGGDADKRWDQWVRQSPSRRLVIAQSLVPGQAPEDWRARGAAGEYDAQFAALGKTLVAAGLGDATIRLAHEGNGTWFKHDIGGTPLEHRQWATYWARVAGILHATPGASFRMDLTVSAGYRVVPLEQWWPGDDAVDVVGVDQHDLGVPGVPTEQPARWRFLMSQDGGFEDVAAFARAHGKPVSVPEWGITNAASSGNGDDAYYVQQMLQLFRREHVEYQGFWDKAGAPGDLAINPRSLTAFRAGIGPATTATP